MKKVLLSSALLLISFIGFSQTKGISYQAVIIDPNPIEIPGKDITAQPYVSKDVWIRFGIYAGSTLQYEELHKTRTDEYGLVNLVIGAGVNTGKAGTFTSLSWDGITKSIITSVSFDQGGRYTEVSNQKFTYVPYTFLAETAVKLAGVLPIASGGTGATNAIAARTNLGLGNVDNTADVDKPVSIATLAIIDTKEAIANKSTNIIADSASSVKYPSVKAIKEYVDSRTANSNLANQANNANLAAKATALETPRTINGVPFDGTANITIPVGVTPPDANASTKGLVQLAGDLTGTAAAPAITANSVTTAKILDGAVTDPKIASVSGSKVTGNIAGNAANVTGMIAVANGGTGATTAAGARTNLGLVIGTDVQAPLTAGVDYLRPNGSAANLTNFPILNQNTTGNAATATLAATSTFANTAALANTANTATKLTTSRNINGVPFDGTADITITTNASTLSGTIGLVNGGTGASTAAGARTNLGLVIGTDVLAQRTFGTAANSAATDFVAATEKGANNGVATLGNNGKIPSTQIPAISFQNVNVVNSDATMTAIAGAQVGSIAIRTDNNNNYVLSALPASNLANWIALATPLYVSTVNGYAGPNVVLTTNDVAEGTSNKYFTDARVRNAISATAPLNFNTTSGVLSMTAASGSSDGYLSSADFTRLNNKQTALTAGVDYATPSGNITGNAANVTGIVSIANGGTGTSTASGALVTLGAEASSNKSNDILVDGSSTTKFPTFKAIKDYVDQQSANAGVADNSISSAKINGTIAVSKGGTGASTAAGARTNLGLVIGTDVMAANATTALTGDVTGSGNGSFATTVNSVGGVSSSTIATLPGLITTNTNAIAANTTSITANTNSIATLNTNVVANTASITANATAIASNTASIATNATAITTEATTARAAELILTNGVNANTASITANSTDISTINTNLALKASLASPAFTGNPTAPTQTTGDNSTKLATTAFVAASITASSAGLSSIGAISSTSNAKGATISGTTELILTPADANFGGIVTTATQTFAGAKTFSNTATFNTDISVNGLTVGGSSTYGNTALGYLALKQVQAGSYNAGSWNTAIGHESMYGNTTGNFNTAIGRGALVNNTTGSYNTTVGYYSGKSLKTISSAYATENTFIGNSSGAGITTGSYNTILGSQTYLIVSGAQVGIGITTGSYNTIIGGQIFGLAPTLSNNIILADGAGNIRAQHNGTTGWTLGTIVSGTWSGTTIGSNVGGAGTVNGLMKANGNGVVSAAVAGTDYQAPLTTTQVGVLSNTSGINTGDQTITLTGDITGIGTGTFTTTLTNSGVIAGSYGSNTSIPTFTVDEKGRLTSAGTITSTAVPYTGATQAVNLGAYDLTVNGLTVGTGINGGAVSNTNTALGASALAGNNSGSGANTAIGTFALKANTTGSNNTGVGYYALQALTTATDNTALGAYALRAGSSGYFNTSIGSKSLFSATTGAGNTAVGVNALYGITNAGNNTAMGFLSLNNLTTGDKNIALGYKSGSGVTSGTSNIMIGANTGSFSMTTGSYNTIIGTDITGLPSTLSNNIILADGAGNIRAQHNGTTGWTLGTIASGTWSGTSIAVANGGTGATTASAARTNLGLGSLATRTTIADADIDASAAIAFSKLNISKADITGLGVQENLTAGSGISINAGTISATGLTTNNIASNAAIANGQLANSATILGTTTMTLGGTVSSVVGLNSISANTIIGTLSGTANSATNLVGGTVGALPYQSASGITNLLSAGTNGQVLTISSGVPAWITNSSSGGINSIGAISGTSNVNGATISGTTELILTPADANFGGIVTTATQTFAGAKTFTNTTTFNKDVLVNGLTVGSGNFSDNSNTALGSMALSLNTSGTGNVAIGQQALTKLTTTNNNTAIGQYASYYSTGTSNTAIGNQALYGVSGSTTGSSNVAIGVTAMQKATTAANNVSIGGASLVYNANGHNNVVLGYAAGQLYGTSAGASLTKVDQSVLIGAFARAGASSSTNEVVIGYNVIGKGTNTVTIGTASNTANYFTGDINLTGNVSGGTWSGTAIGVTKGGTGLASPGAAGNVLTSDGTNWVSSAAASGVNTLTYNTVTSTSYANGGTISGTTLYFGDANATNPGLISTKAQTIAGVKTFSPTITGTYTAGGMIVAGTIFTPSLTSYNNNDILTGLDINPTFTNNHSYVGNYGLRVQGVGIGTGGGNHASNTVVGLYALKSNLSTSYNNSAFGSFALNSNTAGGGNTALGTGALKNGSYISYNTAVGYNALYLADGTTGSHSVGNTAVGYNSQAPSTGSTTGIYNTSLGYSSLGKISSGSYNVALGSGAISNITSASNNVAIGFDAGAYRVSPATDNTTGTNGIFIGYKAQPSANALTDEIVIGASIVGNGSNTVTIGNNSNTKNYLRGDLILGGTGNITSGVWSATAISVAKGGTGLTSVGTNGQVLSSDGTNMVWSNAGSGVSTLTYTTSSSYANGGTISGTSLTLSAADATNPGLVSVGAQTIVGAKTFSNTTTFNSDISIAGNVTSGVWSGTAISIAKGGTGLTSSGNNGYILASDGTNWVSSALSTTYTSTSSINGGAFSGTTLTLTAADATNPGLVSLGAQTLVGAKTFSNTATFNSDISIAGNITSGVWSGTAINITKGGTGLTSSGNNGNILTSDGTNWVSSALSTTYTSTSSSNGGTFSGTTLTLTAADVTKPGLLTASSQIIGGAKTFSSTVTATGALASGTIFSPTLVAAANNDVLAGIDINPNFTNGSFTGVANYGLRVQGIGIGVGGGDAINNVTNTAVGNSALLKNTTTGIWNTGVGYKALLNNLSGSGNTAFGYQSLYNNNSVTYTTALGYNTGNPVSSSYVLTKGIYLGANALPKASSSTTNEIVIGSDLYGNGSNTTTIGNTSTQQSQIYGALIVVPNVAAASTNGASSTISAQSASTNLFNGGALNLNAGNGLTSGIGGDINLNAGDSYFGAGGNINLNAGTSNYTGTTSEIITNADLKLNGITAGRGKGNSTNNTIFGNAAFGSNTTGTNNVAFGTTSLYANTTGNLNTAIGSFALSSLRGVYHNNTAIGATAIQNMMTGGDNVALGYNAAGVAADGTSQVTYSIQGVFIGSNSKPGTTSSTNEIVIGYNAKGQGDNTTTIGNSSTTTTYIPGSLTMGISSGVKSGEITINPQNTQYEGGQINIIKAPALGSAGSNWTIDQFGSTVSDARIRIFPGVDETIGLLMKESGNIGMGVAPANMTYKLNVGGDINATGSVRAAGVVLSSDLRLKTNISSLNSAMKTLNLLSPVSYDKKVSLADSAYEKHEFGFIAQEVQKILPQLVTEGKDKDHLLSMDYISIIPLLTKAMQEQDMIIKEAKKENADLKSELEAQKIRLEKLERVIEKINP